MNQLSGIFFYCCMAVYVILAIILSLDEENKTTKSVGDSKLDKHIVIARKTSLCNQ